MSRYRVVEEIDLETGETVYGVEVRRWTRVTKFSSFNVANRHMGKLIHDESRAKPDDSKVVLEYPREGHKGLTDDTFDPI